MFVNPWQFCVAIVLMIWGTYFITYRFWCRRKGVEYTAQSLEFYITVLVPGPMIPYSMTGKLLQTGKVSLDKVKTNMTYGVVLWVFAIIFLAELY